MADIPQAQPSNSVPAREHQDIGARLVEITNKYPSALEVLANFSDKANRQYSGSPNAFEYAYFDDKKLVDKMISRYSSEYLIPVVDQMEKDSNFNQEKINTYLKGLGNIINCTNQYREFFLLVDITKNLPQIYDIKLLLNRKPEQRGVVPVMWGIANGEIKPYAELCKITGSNTNMTEEERMKLPLYSKANTRTKEIIADFSK